MPYKVEFHPAAKDDFEFLNGSARKEVAKKIDALSINPLMGKPLGNRFGINLTGFYKLYASKKRYRIIYRILGEYLEVIEIVAIGKREKQEVYKLMSKRLKSLKVQRERG